MKIPNKIKIGGHIIKIKKVRTEELKNPADYDDWFRLIRINVDGTPEAKQAEGLLHEIIEAIKAITQIEVSHRDLTIISESLFAAIRDNKLDFRGGEKCFGLKKEKV